MSKTDCGIWQRYYQEYLFLDRWCGSSSILTDNQRIVGFHTRETELSY